MTARSTSAITAAVAILVTAPGLACGDGQPSWCDDLRSLGDLDTLATAISTGDGTAAQAEVGRFTEAAGRAPEEIRDDMEAIAEVLAEVVDVGMAGGGAADTDLERRRERANQRLAEVSEHTAAVGSWAEEECGIRLD